MFRQYRLLLKNIPFILLAISCLIAMFADGLTYIMMAWAVVDAVPGTRSIAIMMLLFWLPSVMLGPFLGVAADRGDFKKLLFCTNGLQSGCLLAFLYLAKQPINVSDVYVLSFIMGSLLALYLPVLMSFVRKLVCTDTLMLANSSIDVSQETGAVIGMCVAGILLNFINYSWFLTVNSIAYLCAFFLIIFIRDSGEKTIQANESFFSQFKYGGQYFFENPSIFLIYIVQGILCVCWMITPVLIAPYAKSILHANVEAFSSLEVAFSVGVVIGGLCNPWIVKKITMIKTILGQCLLGIISLYFFYHTISMNAALVCQFLIGYAFSCWPLATTLAQEVTIFAFQTRAQSIANSLSSILMISIFILLAMMDSRGVFFVCKIEMGLLFLAGILLCIWRLYMPSKEAVI